MRRAVLGPSLVGWRAHLVCELGRAAVEALLLGLGPLLLVPLLAHGSAPVCVRLHTGRLVSRMRCPAAVTVW